MLDELKGVGKAVLACRTTRGKFELLYYPDESWAIRLNDRVIDMWEADRQEDCIDAFGRMIGLQSTSERFLVFRMPPGTLSGGGERSIEQPCAN